MQTKIGLWKTKRQDFFVSHAKGLDEAQITMLHALKVGDKLGMWKNDLEGSCDFSLKAVVDAIER